MKLKKYLWLLLGVMTWLQASAQFNPTNPPEPSEPPETYMLTVTANPDGAASSITQSGKREAGTRVSLSTSPNTGFAFVRWEDSEGNVLSEQRSFSYVMPAHNETVIARFTYSPGNPGEPDEPTEYAQVKLSVSPPDAGSVSGAGKYAVGSSISLRTSGNTGFRFQNWTRDGEIISTQSSFSYEVRSGENYLVANYIYDPSSPDEPSTPAVTRKLILKVKPDGSGSVSPSSGNSYAPWATVTLDAWPNSNYKFVSWTYESGEIVSENARHDFTMPDAKTTLVANFRYSPGSPGEPGAIDPRRNVIYGGRISVSPGSEIFYDINLENIDAVTGINVDVTMPDGFIADYSRAVMTGRTTGHTFTIDQVGDATHRIQIRGTEQIAGGAGAVIRIPVRIPENVEYGVSVIVPMTHGVVVNPDGTQTAVDAMDGILKIADELILADSPDFVITDVFTEKKAVMPGDALTVTWKVANKGTLAATGGWSETISLVNATNKRLALSTVYYETNCMSPGDEVTRSATIGIPSLPGIDGELDVMVELTPFVSSGEIEEMQLNNTSRTSDLPVSLGKILILEMPDAIPEDYDGGVSCTLRRSGSWAESETFAISKSPADDRLVLPESVVIRRDQSEAHFMIFARDNDTMDETSVVTVEISGNGYDPVSSDITIEDNEFAELTVTPSKDDVTEGESFDIVIAIPKPVADPVTLNIVSDHPARFRHPSTVTFAPGETTATVAVNSVDDDEIQLTDFVEFTISADNYQSNTCIIEIHDNDMPQMELILLPSEVSENAGPTAVTATLRRLTNTDKKVIIRLSDNSEKGDIYYPYTTLTMNAGTEVVEFPLGINNNNIVDGDRQVEITAAVYVQSCGCSPTGTEAGLVSTMLTVIDDDGPALSLRSSSTSLVEGDANGILLTVSRNTDTSEACSVTISSDYEQGLTFQKEVTMAKGESSATVKVVAEANDVEDDSRTIVFYAESPGHSKGICHVMLTDRTLPDAVISDIILSATEGEANEEVTVTVTLRNDGAAPLADATKVSFYVGDASEPTAAAYTPQKLNPGETLDLSKSIALPSAVGTYEVYAVVNERKTEKELLYTNNISGKVTVSVLSPFRATLSVDKAIYQRGDEISFSGNVTGKVSEGDEVEIYLINDGLRQTVTSNVDASGGFSAVFTPYSAQIGQFTAGACYPGEGLTTAMASFDVMGLHQESKSAITHQTVVGETVKGSIRLTNPTSVTLTGVKAAAVSKPDNIDISFICPSGIEAGQTVVLEYSVKGTSPSVVGQWDIINIAMESAEGATYDGKMYFYCRNAEGKLEADIQEIRTTMTYEQPREYKFTVTNVGAGETGTISLSLPDWMKPVTSRQMPSLAANESADIVLQFTPSDRMQLNVPVTGQIGVNCENGEGFALKYSVEPVSEATGTLVIDVCDEYTYYTEEAPHVKGAEVTVMHPVSYVVLAKGETDDAGLFSIELPEGYYAVKVTSPRHESYRNTILVDPGRTTTQVVNIGVSGVEVTYTVEETEVEDEYRVETHYTYNTEVPVPIVVMTQDREVNGQNLGVGESTILNLTLTNEGLITALNVTMDDPIASDEWQLTFLDDYSPFDLPAKQSRTIPVKITWLGNSETFRVKSQSPVSPISSCVAGFEYEYEWYCEKGMKKSRVANRIALKICAHSAIINELMTMIGGWTGGSGNGDIFIPSGGGENYYYNEYESQPIDEKPLFCDDEALECAEKIVENLGGQIPGAGPVLSVASDVADKYADNAAGNGGNGGDGNGGNGGGSTPIFTGKDAMGQMGDMAMGGLVDAVVPYGLGGPIQAGAGILQGCWKYIKKNKNTGSYVISRIDREYSETDKLEAYLTQLEHILELFKELYGDEVWYMDDLEASASFFNYAASLDEEAITYDNLLPHKPAHISEDRLAALLERIAETNPENCVDWNHFIALTNEMNQIEADAGEMGYESSADMYVKTIKDIYDNLNDPEGSVCSKVKLQISQSVVMTRQAFRGTLSVSNGSADTPITNFSLTLDIRDRDGNVATSHEFQSNLEKLTGFGGEFTLDGPWTLEPKADGVAQILFIPTRYAVETEPQDYTFSGVLHYTDPYTGLDVTRSLSSVTLTVNPSPVLDLTYFMQRDVYGDDPFTEAIEPSIPGEFALVIDNIGYGDANNVRITTNQPQIIENEKGLLVDFELIGSQLNGEDYTLSFGKTITSDFGTIPAKSSAYAQWWLKCLLAGFFDEYDVKVNHVSSYGNEDLSLLNEATIHELIRGFSIETESGTHIRGFLANDVRDSDYAPDEVYFSDGSESQSVTRAADIQVKADGGNEYVMTVIPASDGWTYGNISDPTAGRQSLVSVTRISDGADIPVDNFWQTPYILRRNEKPVHVQLLHLVANQTGTEAYSLKFAPRPDLELAVESFDGVPEADEPIKQPLKSVNVTFNKEIKPETFTSDDITLYNQGKKLDLSNVAISSVGEREFCISLDGLTSESGLYILTVNTDGITDTDGFQGVEGSSVTWIQDLDPDGLSKNEIRKISIYPLPMQQNVYLSGIDDTVGSIEFYDSKGILRLICRDISTYQAIDVSNLLPDIYIVRISTSKGIHILKARKK